MLWARQQAIISCKELCDWGIRRVFGYPGDGINWVMGALNRAAGKIEFIQVRRYQTKF